MDNYGTVYNYGTISAEVLQDDVGTVYNYGTVGSVDGGRVTKEVSYEPYYCTMDQSAWASKDHNHTDDYTATVIPDAGHVLDDAINAVVTQADGSKTYLKSGTDFDYNPQTGAIRIPNAKLTGPVHLQTYTYFDLSSAALNPSLSEDTFTFNGKEHKPALLLNGVAPGESGMTIVYENNVNAGTGKVTFKAAEKDTAYVGALTLEFTIEPANVEDAQWTVEELTYNSEIQKPVISGKLGDYTLQAADCQISADGYEDVGVYSAKVQGLGNVTGETRLPWSIAPREWSAEVKLWGKLYDGTVELDLEESVSMLGLPDLIQDDDVRVDYERSTASFDDPEVGQNKTVTGMLYLKGADAENYVDGYAFTTKGNIQSYTAEAGVMYTTTTAEWTTEDFTVTAMEGYTVGTQKDGIFGSEITFGLMGENTASFYVKRDSDGRVSNVANETYRIDRTAPEGTVTIGEMSWNSFFEVLYENATDADVTVKFAAVDEEAGVEKIEYYLADKTLYVEDLDAITGWTEGEVVNVPAENGKKFIAYAKLTDKLGNMAYLASNAIVFDTEMPVFTGAEEEVYYVTKKVTVTDRTLCQVDLGDGVLDVDFQEMSNLIEGDRNAEYTLTAMDKAGHVNTVSFRTATIDSLAEPISGITEENVTLDDESALLQILEKIEGIDQTNATEAEKAKLAQIQQQCEKLLARLEEMAQALRTENVEKVLELSEDTVKVSDKQTIENAIEDLENFVETYSGNLTEEDVEDIEAVVQVLEQILDVMEDAVAVQQIIDKLPQTAKPGDEAAEKAADEAEAAYKALTEQQQAMVDTTRLDKLQKALTAATPNTGDLLLPIAGAVCLIALIGMAAILVVTKRKRR